jgi:hypothetical protein
VSGAKLLLWRIVALLLAGLIVLSAAGAGPVSAAGDVTFGEPSAQAVFGKGITFTQPVTAPGVDARYVEIMIQRPGAIGPEVHTISQIGNIANSSLEYSLREDDQHIYPNTTFTARWRITDSAGNVTLGPETTITYLDTRFQWQSAAGKLVRVHWYKGDANFGQRALSIGEAGVAKAEELFGVTETEPVDFYVYADLPAFYGALGPGTRENVGGEALPEIRTLFALITPDQIGESWVGEVIPHELTHLVFDTATKNPYHFPPRWLNEGLAVYLTQGYDGSDRGLVRDAVSGDELIPLLGLAGQFPTRRDKFALAYAESVSAIDFLVRQYGRDALVKLVHTYAEGVTDDAALQGALGVDVKGFNDAWQKDVGAKTPIPVGPQPDPAGPLPSGWSSSAAPAPSAVATPVPTLAASPSGAIGSPAPSGVPSAAPPTLGGPTSVASPAGPGASALLQPTPGLISPNPVAAPSTNVGLAWIFASVALILGALGVGLLAFRRRAPHFP